MADLLDHMDKSAPSADGALNGSVANYTAITTPMEPRHVEGAATSAIARRDAILAEEFAPPPEPWDPIAERALTAELVEELVRLVRGVVLEAERERRKK